MTQPKIDIPDRLIRQLRRARRNHAITWAKAGAAMYPGIMFTAHLGDTLISYEYEVVTTPLPRARPRRV